MINIDLDDIAQDDPFLDKFNERLNNKKKLYEKRKEYHKRSLKKMKKIYFIISLCSSICSVITSFLVGVNTLDKYSNITIISLIFSLFVSILSTILSTADINNKLLRNKDGMDKFDEMIDEIENFNCQKDVKYEQALQFTKYIVDKENLIAQYEYTGCCFD
jgi:hypothetical protein